MNQPNLAEQLQSLMIPSGSFNPQLVERVSEMLSTAFGLFTQAVDGHFYRDNETLLRANDFVGEVLDGTLLIENCQFIDDLHVVLNEQLITVIRHMHVPCFAEKYHGNQLASRIYYSATLQSYIGFYLEYPEGSKPDPYVSKPCVVGFRGWPASIIEDANSVISAVSSLLEKDPHDFSRVEKLYKPVH